MKTDDERLHDAIQAMREFICAACSDYKGMVDCDECGNRYCDFCEWPCC